MKKFVLILATVLLVTCSVMFAFSACATSSESDDNALIMYTHTPFAPYEWKGADGKMTGVDVAIMS